MSGIICPSPHTHTVCWIVVLINDFKHQILTSIWLEANLKHKWRNCLWKKQKIAKSEDNFFNNVSNVLFSSDVVFEISKITQTLISSRFQGMYWHARKTATLTSKQHIVSHCNTALVWIGFLICQIPGRCAIWGKTGKT